MKILKRQQEKPMLDDMCGLQAKFFHTPSFHDLEQEITTLHDELMQK